MPRTAKIRSATEPRQGSVSTCLRVSHGKKAMNKAMTSTLQSLRTKAQFQEYLESAVLRNGQVALIRPLGPNDKPVLIEEMQHMSEESIYFRYLTPKKELSKSDLAYFTEIDMVNHVALLACIKEGDSIISAGVGRYIIDNCDQTSAEVAFEVKEEYQGLGIATILLKTLTKIARKSGLKRFTAYMLAENHKMLDVFAHSGLPMVQQYQPNGILEVAMSLA